MIGVLCMGLVCLVMVGMVVYLVWTEYHGVKAMAPGQIYRRNSGSPFHSTTIMIDAVEGKWCSYHYVTIDNLPIDFAREGGHSEKKSFIYQSYTLVTSHD